MDPPEAVSTRTTGATDTQEVSKVSILILTKNEQDHLPKLLDTLGGFDDVVLFDSGSTDETVQIAEDWGCRVVTRPFDDWASHQNWAMEHIDFKHRWVFYLDADERMTPELKDEITAIAERETPEFEAYFAARKNFLFGTWLKRSMAGGYVMRFFQPGKIKFERMMSVQPVLEGPAGYLQAQFPHYHFSRGFRQWFEKHAMYAGLEALEWQKAVEGTANDWAGLFSLRDPVRRQQALKRLSYDLPFRPLLKFGHMYVLKRGFLDGRAGWHCCLLMGVYEYMIGLQYREIVRRQRGEMI
ncbi:MAG: glycosyltransferase family 2 protein [Planctomycetota bacterium]